MVLLGLKNMNDEGLSYKTLRKIQHLEKNSPLLSKIETGFYQHLSSYLQRLQALFDEEKDIQKIKIITEELENTKKIAKNIYELRERKIVQAALSSTRGGNADLHNFLEDEHTLFTVLANQLNQQREHLLEQQTKISEKTITGNIPHAEILREEQKNQNTNQMVRVTETIPEFVGTDMKIYQLYKDDVLSLPEDMIKPLQKRNVIEQIH